MIDDMLYVHSNAGKNTIKNIKLVPALALHIFVYGIIYYLARMLLASISGSVYMLTGFLSALVRAALFSHLLFTLDGIVNYDRIYWKNLSEGFSRFASPSIAIFFLYWIFELAIGLIMQGRHYPSYLIKIINLVLFLIFSAAGESVYIGGAYSYESILSSARLLTEEPLNWTVFHIVLFLIFDSIGININVFRPSFELSLKGIVGVFVLAIYLVYNGHLYKELYMSNKRKREYMR